MVRVGRQRRGFKGMEGLCRFQGEVSMIISIQVMRHYVGDQDLLHIMAYTTILSP
jgi:hypothetical protein